MTQNYQLINIYVKSKQFLNMGLINFAKKAIRPLYYFIKLRLKYIWILVFAEKPVDFKKDIPIIINNFNQLDFLLILLNSLEVRGYKNVIILDNNSSYPPLLEFYKTTKYKVIFLKSNYGHLALWKSGIYKKFYNQYFVYTDSDLKIDDECPDDFLEYFFEILQQNKLSSKVGFSLHIDNIPNYFDGKEDVIKWESQYWTKELSPRLFSATIDTTFALYRPYTKYGSNISEHHIRVGAPYSMNHLPWYVDSNNLSENMKYYIESCEKCTHWTRQMKK